MTDYRTRVLQAVVDMLQPLGPLRETLDFGAGDGYFAHHLAQRASLGTITPVDVVERATSHVRPRLYDGRRLPFDDTAFDLAYAVDVLHHCPDPLDTLRDLARCTRRYLLLKDHHCRGALGRFTLGVLDELGNRRFGIPSPYRYQRDWAWVDWLEANGFRRLAWRHPLPCHRGPLALTNGLQFLGLWERCGD